MSTLTARQQQILDFLHAHMQREALPPTMAEIAAAFGLASVNGVAKHLQALAAKGHLELMPNKARGIRLREGGDLPRASATPGTGATRKTGMPGLLGQRARQGQLALPILGRVAAGEPIGAANEFDEQLLVDRALFHSRPDYLLRVKGDSMRDDGIFDGDLVAIRQADSAENGQIVVARIDGELTIKRLQVGARGIRLLPRNPDYAPIEVPADAEFAIEGLYCGLVRRG